MDVVLSVFGAVAIVLGGAFSAYAMIRFRSSSAPPLMFSHPRYWKPIWKTRAWFTSERGYVLYVTGTGLLILGSALVVWIFIDSSG